MGELPRNAVVLADQQRLAATWDELGADEAWRLRSANSRYLVRGVRAPIAFHPKTYLAADQKRGTLFVGSGNLTLGGIEQGHETFVQFDSDNGGLHAILAWASWITTIVEGLDDAVAERWRELRRAASWLRGEPASSGGFVHNLSQSLLDQLFNSINERPACLHATAPFFDERAQAFRSVVERLSPERVRLYLCRDASVDGSHLVRQVEELGVPIEILRYDADFVHAKLVATSYESGAGLVLSGSANLSQAALLRTGAAGADGNLEAGAITEMPSEEIRRLFEPDHLQVSILESSQLLAYRFERSAPPPAERLLTLNFARFAANDHVEIDVDGNPESVEGMQLAYSAGFLGLDGALSSEPLTGDREEAIVWLVDQDGEKISNRVPVDDPDALRKQLSDHTDRTDRPSELDLSDVETPVGQMLVRLQSSCIFDFDELPKPSADAAERGDVEADDDSLWERLLQEELMLDPRLASYRAFDNTLTGADDPLLLLLESMLGGVPVEAELRPVGSSRPGSTADEGEEESGIRRWSPERRLQLRLFNVLKRWSVALADPRFFWISQTAGARNYSALLVAIWECWVEEYLPDDRVRQLLEALFAAFIRGERSRGYLWLVQEDERQAVIDAIPAKVREMAMTMTFVVFEDETIAHPYIFDWQPFLKPALEREIFRSGQSAADLVEGLFERECSPADITRRVNEVACYTNDERWSTQLAQELGFDRVVLGVRQFRGARLVITVDAGTDLLEDPRIPRLVRKALEYRTSEVGAFVETAGSPTPRLRFERGGKAGIIRDNKIDLIAERLTWDELLRLDAGALPFADLIHAPAAAA